MTSRLIPITAMEKLLKKGGAERVSDKAKSALKENIRGILHKYRGKGVKAGQACRKKDSKGRRYQAGCKRLIVDAF